MNIKEELIKIAKKFMMEELDCDQKKNLPQSISNEDRNYITELERHDCCDQDYISALLMQFKDETTDNLISSKMVEKKLKEFDENGDIESLKQAIDVYNFISIKKGYKRINDVLKEVDIVGRLKQYNLHGHVPLSGGTVLSPIFVDLYGGYYSEGVSEGNWYTITYDDYTYYRHPSLPNFNNETTGLHIMNFSSSPYEVILFQNKNYKGRFKRFHCKGDGSFADATYNYIGDFMNNRTSSLLIVKHRDNEMEVSLTDIKIKHKKIKDLIEEMFSIKKHTEHMHKDVVKVFGVTIEDVDVNVYSGLEKKPVITWDMWNPHIYALDDYKMIKIEIPIETKIHYHAGGFFNCSGTQIYHSNIIYWIYPYIDMNHKLKAHVDMYDQETKEDSNFTSIVEEKMFQEAGKHVDKINSYLKDAVSALSGLNFKYLYLLPGDGGNHGYTEDGVIMMLQKE
ncbi:MAG: hypothetical protein GX421_08030 [Caldisericales bacterium]|nr:hypothetical protein [Caldisericales bacterium]